jgi:hypothetical protein
MKTATRYLTSTIAVLAAFVAVNIIYLAQSTCNDCVIHYGLPFTFYEQGSGWGFAVQRFVS